MAKLVNKDLLVTVNGVDLSARVRSAEVMSEAPELEATAMQDDYQAFAKGIPDASIVVEFYQDFSAGSVHATLQPLSQTDTPFPVNVRPTSGAISTTNPEFQMPAALLFGYPPIGGGINEMMMVSVTFRNAGPLGIVVDTTP